MQLHAVNDDLWPFSQGWREQTQSAGNAVCIWSKLLLAGLMWPGVQRLRHCQGIQVWLQA